MLVERRAAEPVLPLHLFRQRVSTAAAAIGVVVGFAMFGALTYLPKYLQIVKAVGPTSSGLRLLPMMAGLLVTSTTSGATFFRSIGGSFGTAVFGAVFDNVLPGNITTALHGLPLPPGVGVRSGASPAAIAALPPRVHAALVAGMRRRSASFSSPPYPSACWPSL